MKTQADLERELRDAKALLVRTRDLLDELCGTGAVELRYRVIELWGDVDDYLALYGTGAGAPASVISVTEGESNDTVR